MNWKICVHADKSTREVYTFRSQVAAHAFRVEWLKKNGWREWSRITTPQRGA